jgi:hypothetical protein
MTKKTVSTTAAAGPMTMTAVARAAAPPMMTAGPENIVTKLDFAAFRWSVSPPLGSRFKFKWHLFESPCLAYGVPFYLLRVA